MKRKLVSLALWFPVVLYFAWLFRFAVNVPQLDDFGAVFVSVLALRKAGSWSEFWYVLFNYHNEHRIVYTRVVAFLVSWVSAGPIDFRVLMLAGSLALLALLGLCFRSFRLLNLPVWNFLPVPFLLFQLQNFENTYFAMASLQNFGVWAWGALALWTLLSALATGKPLPDRRFGLAVGLAILATYTSGNGLLVFAVGSFVLLYRQRFRALALWLAAGATTTLCYISGNAPLMKGGVSSPLTDKVLAATGFLGAFVGKSVAGLNGVAVVGSLMVLTVLLTGCLPLLKSYGAAGGVSNEQRARLFGVSLFAFIFLTAVAIALNRAPDDVVSTSRYKVASMLALIVVYLLVLQTARPALKAPVAGVFLTGSVLFCLMTYWKNTPFVIRQREVLLQDAADFADNQPLSSLRDMSGFAPEKHWKKAVQAGLYRFPDEGPTGAEKKLALRESATVPDSSVKVPPKLLVSTVVAP